MRTKTFLSCLLALFIASSAIGQAQKDISLVLFVEDGVKWVGVAYPDSQMFILRMRFAPELEPWIGAPGPPSPPNSQTYTISGKCPDGREVKALVKLTSEIRAVPSKDGQPCTIYSANEIIWCRVYSGDKVVATLIPPQPNFQIRTGEWSAKPSGKLATTWGRVKNAH